MASQVLDPVAAAAIDLITAGFDTLRGAGLDPADAEDAAVLVRELEVIGRRARAAQVQAMDRVDRRGLHRVDGHASVKVFVRHHAQLSRPQALEPTESVAAQRLPGHPRPARQPPHLPARRHRAHLTRTQGRVTRMGQTSLAGPSASLSGRVRPLKRSEVTPR